MLVHLWVDTHMSVNNCVAVCMCVDVCVCDIVCVDYVCKRVCVSVNVMW